MKIKLFATLKERAKASEIAIDTSMALDASGAMSVGSLRAAVAQQFPALAPLMQQTLVAVNQEFAFNDDPVQPGDEVALFPPVSGG